MIRKNVICWFEIIATDFDRACRFYETILGHAPNSMQPMDMPPGKMAFFPSTMDMDGVSGAIWYDGGHSRPSMTGTRIYLNCNGNLDEVIARIEPAGGKVLQPKMSIGEFGFICMFADTEGNFIGLHSPT